MAVKIPLELISHTRRIGNLYKRWLRNLEVKHFFRHEYRYHACVARVQFEKLIKEKDMVKAKQMIEDLEEELFQSLHPQQKFFPDSPGGVLFGRFASPPDCIIDYWHPLEKSIYPKYFAKRELRKQQYIEMWERQYGSCKDKQGK